MNMGGRAYPVRHYPIAIRLRDREGRAVLCSHYFLSVGTLRVLHSECVPSHSFTALRQIVYIATHQLKNNDKPTDMVIGPEGCLISPFSMAACSMIVGSKCWV